MNIKSRILLVEDDYESNENLKRFLLKTFDDVICAYDGLEGWKLFQAYEPQIVITDILMPKLDGLDMIRKIRDVDSECFIAVLSAYSDQQHLMRAVSLKLDAYVLKPISSLKLASLIKKIRSSKKTLHHQTYTINESISYDVQSKVITKEGQQITLANREIALLELLLDNRAEIVSYEMIEYTLYDTEETSRNAVKIIISNLRKKIGFPINSIPKVGYSLP